MLKYILLIGIGGSSQGAKAVYEALRGAPSHDGVRPEMLFSETVSTTQREQILSKLRGVSKQDIALLYVSKSGTTMESLENLEFFKPHVGEVIAVPYPPDVSGRFSVFTTVGMMPLEMAGFDMKKFLKGKEEAGEVGNIDAILQYPIWNMFFFNPELESLGKWWRQLIAESLGKDGKGTMPIVSIGTNDLHSTLQLYMDGPKNIYTTFISAKPLPPLVEKILGAVKQSYANHGLPFDEYVLEKLDEYELGRFMQYYMQTTVALAQKLGVDPYTQPAVEEYKSIARRLT